MLWRKIKQGKGIKYWQGVLLLYVVARDDLHEAMTFKWKPEGNEGETLQISGQRTFQTEAVVSAKTLGRVGWAYLRNKMLEKNRQGGVR